MGRGQNMIPRDATLYYLKCPAINKKLTDMHKNRKVCPIHRKQKQLIDAVPEELTTQRL